MKGGELAKRKERREQAQAELTEAQQAGTRHGHTLACAAAAAVAP